MQYVREFYSHRLIVFLLLTCLSSGIAFFATGVGALSWVTFAAGIVLVIVTEYAVHRFILHEFPRLIPAMYKGHVAHHEHPNDTDHLFGPVRYDLAGYTVIFVLVWLFSGSLHIASSLVFGAVLCQLFYQWKHFVSHRPIVPITPWGKWMKKKHLLHHHLDDHAWYGVSNPILDVLLGTNHPTVKNKPKRTAMNDHIHRPL
jgi:hypothetical protein